MKMKSLRDLFVDELKDLYNAEKQLVKALPKMAKGASSPELKAALKDHLAVTRGQVERLERVFKELGASPRGKKCKGMEGLIDEGDEVLKHDGDPAVLDAALIGAAQRVEHYEIAGYGCARTHAEQLGHAQLADLLQETLDEEADADRKLTELAEATINAEAGADDDEDEPGLRERMMEGVSAAAERVGGLVKSATKTVRKAVGGKKHAHR